MSIGKEIKAARERKGITQIQLAEMLMTEQPAISRLESGRENISVLRAAQIAEALGMKLVVKLVDK